MKMGGWWYPDIKPKKQNQFPSEHFCTDRRHSKFHNRRDSESTASRNNRSIVEGRPACFFGAASGLAPDFVPLPSFQPTIHHFRILMVLLEEVSPMCFTLG